MIRIEGRDGHAPTRRLSAALHARHPHLAAPGTAGPHLVLSILPRSTDPWPGLPMAGPDAWYDLYWTRRETATDEDGLTDAHTKAGFHPVKDTANFTTLVRPATVRETARA